MASHDLAADTVGVTEIQAFKHFNTTLQFFSGVKTQNWIFVVQIAILIWENILIRTRTYRNI